MKFLIQIPQLIFGGAEKVLVHFANDLVSRGHSVEILETYEKGLLKDQFDSRVTFHAVCSKAYTKKYYASLAAIRAERNLLKKCVLCGNKLFSRIVGYERFAKHLAKKHYHNAHYDVAINYLEIESPEFLRSAVKADKYLQWYHTDVANLEHPEETDALIPAFSKMDAIICVAESAKKSFVERYPALADKTYVLYNYFDAEYICRKAEEPFSFNDNRFVILSVGRMTPPKKYLRFLDVLARLKSEEYSFVWHVLGTGADYDAICEKIDKLGLADCVVLDGVTDNPYMYMKNCDLFVLPSGWEGFPTVTVEAKLCGCAVLATDVSGIREQIVHGENGWIVENSEEGIYEGLRMLLDEQKLIAGIRNTRNPKDIFDNQKKYEKLLSYLEISDAK